MNWLGTLKLAGGVGIAFEDIGSPEGLALVYLKSLHKILLDESYS